MVMVFFRKNMPTVNKKDQHYCSQTKSSPLIANFLHLCPMALSVAIGHELWGAELPSMDMIQLFGCSAWVGNVVKIESWTWKLVDESGDAAYQVLWSNSNDEQSWGNSAIFQSNIIWWYLSDLVRVQGNIVLRTKKVVLLVKDKPGTQTSTSNPSICPNLFQKMTLSSSF